MFIREQIERLKKIEILILDYLDKEENVEEVFQNLIKQIKDDNIINNKYSFKTFLYLLSSIINDHYRNPNFFNKIEMILMIFKKEIKKYFTNHEIYNIYKRCPRIILFFYTAKIFELNSGIISLMTVKMRTYLFPEKVLEIGINKESLDDFKEKRQIGENDDTISQIIRKDSIEEFIIFVNKNDYSLKSKIKKSIFETNSFLIKHKKTTLIEYAAFFGSTQIFKYLYKNGVELTSSLWIYAIHSDNPEMIHLLTENKVEPPNKSYEKCIKESIKCHHNDVTNYILSNLINDDIESIEKTNFETNYDKNIYYYSFHYYNFNYFPKEMNNKIFFYYACQYDYYQIVEYFMKTVGIDIKEKII